MYFSKSLAPKDTRSFIRLLKRVHPEKDNSFCKKLFKIKKDNFLGMLELSYHDEGYQALFSFLKNHGLKVVFDTNESVERFIEDEG